MTTPKDMADAVAAEEAAWKEIEKLVSGQGEVFALAFYSRMNEYKRATIRRMQMMSAGANR